MAYVMLYYTAIIDYDQSLALICQIIYSLIWLVTSDTPPCHQSLKFSSYQFAIWNTQLDRNKTIKDGDIAPWLIWNNLSTWPNGKIWTNRKEKNNEIGLNHRNREDSIAFAFLTSAFAPSALRPCIQHVSLIICKIRFQHFGLSQTLSDNFIMIPFIKFTLCRGGLPLW